MITSGPIRRLVILMTMALLLSVCGGAEERATTTIESLHSTTEATVASTPTTTGATTTTTMPRVAPFTVESLRRTPDRALGDTAALGSGCTPVGGPLPDGAWFGWVDDAGASSIDFDLACIWPGRIDPAVSNDSAGLRTLNTTDTTLVYLSRGDPIDFREWHEDRVIDRADNAPGLPDTTAFWVFVNGGVVTEMAVYPDAIYWTLSEEVWPEGLQPGCCDMGDVVPPSPSADWPDTGWPADGFYAVITERSADSIDLVIHRFLSCRENPGLCPEWWVGEEVIVDMEEPGLERTLPLDQDLTVVIQGIGGTLVGDGASYAQLRGDIDQSVETWVKRGTGGLDEERAEDPSYPFGQPTREEGWPMMYRGPGGCHLTFYEWWTVLEIREGSPILYFHAGLIAG